MSSFYKCPNCQHVIYKNPTFAMLAGADVGVSVLGGGCPDCGAELDAQAIYVDSKYDISLQEIANRPDGQELMNNLRSKIKDGSLKLTQDEIDFLESADKSSGILGAIKRLFGK